MIEVFQYYIDPKLAYSIAAGVLLGKMIFFAVFETCRWFARLFDHAGRGAVSVRVQSKFEHYKGTNNHAS